MISWLFTGLFICVMALGFVRATWLKQAREAFEERRENFLNSYSAMMALVSQEKYDEAEEIRLELVEAIPGISYQSELRQFFTFWEWDFEKFREKK